MGDGKSSEELITSHDMIQNKGKGISLVFKSQLCHFLAPSPWENDLESVGLDLFTYEIRTIPPDSQRCCDIKLNDLCHIT